MSAEREARSARVAAAATGPTLSNLRSIPGRAARWVGHRARGTDRSLWGALLAAFAAAVTLVCWALSSPPGSSPDDTFHLNSIWCAQGPAEGRCQSSPDNPLQRIVPHQVTTPQCFTGNTAQSAGCRADDYDDQLVPDAGTEIGNWSDRGYPPVYYAVMSMFVQNTLDESVTVMRTVNAMLVVLLVGGLAWLLPQRLRFLAPVTFVITAVPLALFMYSSVNPTGWATLSAGLLWLAVYAAYEVTGWRQSVLLGVALVAALMGSGARADAALFSMLGVALALGLRLAVLRQQWRVTLSAIGIMAISAVLFLTSGHSSVVGTGFPGGEPTPPFEGWTLLLANAIQVPFLWTSTLGAGPMSALGWFDTPVPWVVGIASVMSFSALLFTGWASMWWQKAVALLVILVGLVSYPLILLQESGLYIGGGVQPRYLLPMMVMLAGVSLLPKGESRPRLTRFQVVALTSALTMAQSVALYLNLWRYIKGITTPIASLGAYDWWWESLFLSPTAIWLIGSLAFAGVAGYVLSLLARPDDDSALSGGTVPVSEEASSPAAT